MRSSSSCWVTVARPRLCRLMMAAAAALLLLTGCGDVCEGHKSVYYVDGYATPGQSVTVQVGVPWQVLASHITRITATAPEIGLEAKEVYSTKETADWNTFETWNTFPQIVKRLIKGSPRHDWERIEIPIPQDAKARGKIRVRLDVGCRVAKWASPGNYRTSMNDDPITISVTVVPAGTGPLYRLKDLGVALFVLAALTVVYRLIVRRMEKRWKYEEGPYAVAFIAWSIVTIWLAAWPMAGTLGVPKHWIARWLFLAVLLGVAYGIGQACTPEEDAERDASGDTI